MNRKIISEILTGHWCIERQWADAHFPLVIALLKGSTAVSFAERSGYEGTEMPFAIDPATMQRYNLYAYVDGRGYVANPNIPANSVGILPMTGPLTYYNGDCGEPGMMQRLNWLMDLNSRSNIGSVVQLIDTPGGIATAAPNYVAQMAKMQKPVLSWVDNTCASLGMWFSAGSKETYLGNEQARMGSIGSYCMMLDISGALEMQGMKLIEIYAPQSKDKNKDYKDALAGDTSAIEEQLRIHVDVFIKHVNANLPAAAANQKEWGGGKMFFAQDAVKLGLANGVKPFEQVISKAAWLGKRNK